MQPSFAHICVRTRDLKATEQFYTKVLGLKKTFDFVKNGKAIGFYVRISGTNFIEFFEDSKAESVPSSIAHLCLQVDNIDKAQAELSAAGVTSSKKTMGCDQSWQTWFKDPNGIDIELHEYTKASSQLTGKDVTVDW